jgi:hypothetical protein
MSDQWLSSVKLYYSKKMSNFVFNIKKNIKILLASIEYQPQDIVDRNYEWKFRYIYRVARKTILAFALL